jgi:hypothetical protein
MLLPGRKNHIAEFPFRKKLLPSLLLAMLFAAGILLLSIYDATLITAYLVLWIASYPVIYAGTCRYCANYGKPCPVVLEGGMVHRFFKRGTKHFGIMALIWACVAYTMRIAVPCLVIVQNRLWSWGMLIGVLFSGYWIVHIWIVGCPNCVNYYCLLNPGRE